MTPHLDQKEGSRREGRRGRGGAGGRGMMGARTQIE
jgi:hypothetical protein